MADWEDPLIQELLERLGVDRSTVEEDEEVGSTLRKLIAEAYLRREEAKELSYEELSSALETLQNDLKRCKDSAKRVLLQMDITFIRSELGTRDGAGSECSSPGRSPGSPSGLHKSVVWLEGSTDIPLDWCLARDTTSGQWNANIVSCHHEALLFYDIGHVRQQVSLRGATVNRVSTKSSALKTLQKQQGGREFFACELRVPAMNNAKFLLAVGSNEELTSWMESFDFAANPNVQDDEEAEKLWKEKPAWGRAIVEGFLYKRSASAGALFGISPKWKRRYCRIVYLPDRRDWTLLYYTASSARNGFRLADIQNLDLVETNRVRLPEEFHQDHLQVLRVQLARGFRARIDAFAVHDAAKWKALFKDAKKNPLEEIREVNEDFETGQKQSDDETEQEASEKDASKAEYEDDNEVLDEDYEDDYEDMEDQEDQIQQDLDQQQQHDDTPTDRSHLPPVLPPLPLHVRSIPHENDVTELEPVKEKPLQKKADPVQPQRPAPIQVDSSAKKTERRQSSSSQQSSPRKRKVIDTPMKPTSLSEQKTPVEFEKQEKEVVESNTPAVESAFATACADVEKLTGFVNDLQEESELTKAARRLCGELSMHLVSVQATYAKDQSESNQELALYFNQMGRQALQLVLTTTAKEHSAMILEIADNVSKKSNEEFSKISLSTARVVKGICALAKASTESLFDAIKSSVDNKSYSESMHSNSMEEGVGLLDVRVSNTSSGYESEEFSDCEELHESSSGTSGERANNSLESCSSCSSISRESSLSQSEEPVQVPTISSILKTSKQTAIERLTEQIMNEHAAGHKQATESKQQTPRRKPPSIPEEDEEEQVEEPPSGVVPHIELDLCHATDIFHKLVGPDGRAWLEALTVSRAHRREEQADNESAESKSSLQPKKKTRASKNIRDEKASESQREKPRQLNKVRRGRGNSDLSVQTAPPRTRARKASLAEEKAATKSASTRKASKTQSINPKTSEKNLVEGWGFKRGFRDAFWVPVHLSADSDARVLKCCDKVGCVFDFPLRGAALELLGKVPKTDATVNTGKVCDLFELSLTLVSGEWISLAFSKEQSLREWLDAIRPLCRQTKEETNTQSHPKTMAKPGQIEYDLDGRRVMPAEIQQKITTKAKKTSTIDQDQRSSKMIEELSEKKKPLSDLAQGLKRLAAGKSLVSNPSDPLRQAMKSALVMEKSKQMQTRPVAKSTKDLQLEDLLESSRDSEGIEEEEEKKDYESTFDDEQDRSTWKQSRGSVFSEGEDSLFASQPSVTFSVGDRLSCLKKSTKPLEKALEKASRYSPNPAFQLAEAQRRGILQPLLDGSDWFKVAKKGLSLQRVWFQLDPSLEMLWFNYTDHSDTTSSKTEPYKRHAIHVRKICKLVRGAPSARLLTAAVDSTRAILSLSRTSAMSTNDTKETDVGIAQETFECALMIEAGNGLSGYEEQYEFMAPDADVCEAYTSGLDFLCSCFESEASQSSYHRFAN